VYRSAVIARDKAITNGFSKVEVHIEAPGMSRADVAAEFAKPSAPGTYLDGTGTAKVVVHCSGGEVFEPPSQGAPFVPPPGHVDGKTDDKEKAGARTGG
jgi:hypothetical protein